jgi:hypothetical protein
MNADGPQMNADKARKWTRADLAQSADSAETLHLVYPRSSAAHLRSSAFQRLTLAAFAAA